MKHWSEINEYFIVITEADGPQVIIQMDDDKTVFEAGGGFSASIKFPDDNTMHRGRVLPMTFSTYLEAQSLCNEIILSVLRSELDQLRYKPLPRPLTHFGR